MEARDAVIFYLKCFLPSVIGTNVFATAIEIVVYT